MCAGEAGRLCVAYTDQETVPVIEALDGQLITNRIDLPAGWLLDEDLQQLVSNTGKDILKMVVVNRYQPAKPSMAFIRNFGLEAGALASSVAHDSHNIVAVGTDDESLCQCHQPGNRPAGRGKLLCNREAGVGHRITGCWPDE